MSELVQVLHELREAIENGFPGHGMSWSDWSAVVSMPVAILALGFGIWSQIQQRRHNELSVEPLLKLVPMYPVGGDMFGGLALKNIGIGPALIRGARLIVDGEHEIRHDSRTWASVYKRLGLEQENVTKEEFLFDDLPVGSGLGVGESIMMLERVPCESPEKWLRLCRVGFEVDYISSYERRRSAKTEKFSFVDVLSPENQDKIREAAQDSDFSEWTV